MSHPGTAFTSQLLTYVNLIPSHFKFCVFLQHPTYISVRAVMYKSDRKLVNTILTQKEIH